MGKVLRHAAAHVCVCVSVFTTQAVIWLYALMPHCVSVVLMQQRLRHAGWCTVLVCTRCVSLFMCVWAHTLPNSMWKIAGKGLNSINCCRISLVAMEMLWQQNLLCSCMASLFFSATMCVRMCKCTWPKQIKKIHQNVIGGRVEEVMVARK